MKRSTAQGIFFSPSHGRSEPLPTPNHWTDLVELMQGLLYWARSAPCLVEDLVLLLPSASSRVEPPLSLASSLSGPEVSGLPFPLGRSPCWASVLLGFQPRGGHLPWAAASSSSSSYSRSPSRGWGARMGRGWLHSVCKGWATLAWPHRMGRVVGVWWVWRKAMG